MANQLFEVSYISRDSLVHALYLGSLLGVRQAARDLLLETGRRVTVDRRSCDGPTGFVRRTEPLGIVTASGSGSPEWTDRSGERYRLNPNGTLGKRVR